MKAKYNYQVICPKHGAMGLTDEEYSRQLSRPDDFWSCPMCHRTAMWDDDYYEAHLSQESDESIL